MAKNHPKLRIAIVYDMIYPFHIGGAEYRNYEVAKRLALRGHDVHLIGVKLWTGPDTICKDGITIHGICRYKQLYGFGGKRSIREAIRFALAVKRFFSKSENKGYDIVDSASFVFLHNFALKLSLPNTTKLIITWHQYFGSYWFTYTNPIVATISYLVENLTINLTKDHICVAEKTKKDILQRAHRQINTFVSNNGIDHKSIKRLNTKKNIDILFVGRLQEQKNIFLLLNAVKLLNQYTAQSKTTKNTVTKKLKCIIIGDGPQKESIRKFIASNNLNSTIELQGNTKNREELYNYYRRAKVFALPSLLEGFAIVALEAMAFSLPVVTIDSPTNHAREVMGNSVINTKNSAHAFAYAIKELLSNPEKLKIIGAENEKQSHKFEWNKIIDDLESNYISAKGSR